MRSTSVLLSVVSSCFIYGCNRSLNNSHDIAFRDAYKSLATMKRVSCGSTRQQFTLLINSLESGDDMANRVGDILRTFSDSFDLSAIQHTNFALRVGPTASTSHGVKEVVSYLRERGAGQVMGVVKPLHAIVPDVWRAALSTLNNSLLFDGIVVDTSNLLNDELEDVVAEATRFSKVSLLVRSGQLSGIEPFLESGHEVWYWATEFVVPTLQTYTESFNNPFIIYNGDGLKLASFFKIPSASPIANTDVFILDRYSDLISIVWSMNSGKRQNCLLADKQRLCSGEQGTSEFGSLSSWSVFCRFAGSFGHDERVVIDSVEKIPKNWF